MRVPASRRPRIRPSKARVLVRGVAVLPLLGMALLPSCGGDESTFEPTRWMVENEDADGDGDGLSDYQEQHKYGTDPTRADTDRDGISDGDWNERREYTYTIRSELELVKSPADQGPTEAMNNDYQDARLVEDRGSSVVVEVISYPFTTNLAAIGENPRWRTDDQRIALYLQPGLTANWDEGMRQGLEASLSRDGIVPDSLTDRALAEKLGDWVLDNLDGDSIWIASYVVFENGMPVIWPDFRRVFDREKAKYHIASDEQALQEGLYGRGMYLARRRGSCTPTAIVQDTLLAALGMPARIVEAIPVVDANVPEQIDLVRRGITHPALRDEILTGLGGTRGYAAHTFNEVFVGKRWVNLNYDRLGQEVVDRDYFGMLVYVGTFPDWSDSYLPSTWGLRYAYRLDDRGVPPGQPALLSLNPYRCLALSEQYGLYYDRSASAPPISSLRHAHPARRPASAPK